MDSYRRTAIATGVLFIVATATSLLATAVLQPLVTGPAYLSALAGSPTRVAVGSLLELVAAGTCAGIAISLYPVLRRWDSGLALGSVVFRAIEAVMYTLATLCLLSLLTVAQSASATTGVDRPGFQAIGGSLIALREVAVNAGVAAFVIGALMYYAIMFRSGLVPRWLSGWGIVAELIMIVASLAALFSHVAVASYALLALPIAVQEMVLAVWLIARGFSAGVIRVGGGTLEGAGTSGLSSAGGRAAAGLEAG